MHHSEHESEDIRKILGLGATGKFPEGKLVKEDEGEIKIAIGAAKGKVVIDFGTPVAWIGFSPKQARRIAESIRRHSHEADSQPKD